MLRAATVSRYLTAAGFQRYERGGEGFSCGDYRDGVRVCWRVVWRCGSANAAKVSEHNAKLADLLRSLGLQVEAVPDALALMVTGSPR